MTIAQKWQYILDNETHLNSIELGFVRMIKNNINNHRTTRWIDAMYSKLLLDRQSRQICMEIV
jgi:hypothetical protein